MLDPMINSKSIICAVKKRINTSLKDISVVLNYHG